MFFFLKKNGSQNRSNANVSLTRYLRGTARTAGFTVVQLTAPRTRERIERASRTGARLSEPGTSGTPLERPANERERVLLAGMRRARYREIPRERYRAARARENNNGALCVPARPGAATGCPPNPFDSLPQPFTLSVIACPLFTDQEEAVGE